MFFRAKHFFQRLLDNTSIPYYRYFQEKSQVFTFEILAVFFEQSDDSLRKKKNYSY